ncbi:FAD-binding oxidoreductase [Acholeplasma equirhinis]|uniref:FAD-binding oxidoreductase n=1 Tax=Acholeplasma equirhinis TaxID=555393 RepID=UPI00197AEFBB|nr:FAD-binding oxidoreductase [Acholeplasma equirhinis]MBN3490782.1 FAD-binding oxidoreductase [Acholeplasma equirhinis]
MNYKKMYQEDVKVLTSIVGEDFIEAFEDVNEMYSMDKLGTVKNMPEAVLHVENKFQIQQIMKYAYQENIPVTVRGAGTSLVGGSVAVMGGIMLDMSRMNKIKELDQINLTLTVEPGVKLFEIYQAVEPEGLFYAPDPGEKNASIGGNISTNAGGMRAIKYGTTREWVRALEVVTPKGELLKFGSKVVKNSTGYGLKDLIIGSEGTLAIIVEATLKLIPKPRFTKSMLVCFDNREKAINAAPRLIKDYVLPTAVEYFEKQALDYNEAFLGTSVDGGNYQAYLLLSYDNNDDVALDKDIANVSKLVLENYGASEVMVVDPTSKRSNIWNVRGGFLTAINASTSFMDECDVVLPRARISEFLAYVREVSSELSIRIPYFGHIGDGNLHIYLCKDDIPNEKWDRLVEEGFDKLYKKAFEFGGLVSGEHGIGIAKRAYMKQLLGEEQLELMRGIKSVFDPKNILNPMKVIS